MLLESTRQGIGLYLYSGLRLSWRLARNFGFSLFFFLSSFYLRRVILVPKEEETTFFGDYHKSITRQHLRLQLRQEEEISGRLNSPELRVSDDSPEKSFLNSCSGCS